MDIVFPPNHPSRQQLNDEVHARPPNALTVPLQVSYLVMLCPASDRDLEWQHVGALLSRYGHSLPVIPANYHFAQLSSFAIRYERHTEFSRYTMTSDFASEDYFATNALSRVPSDWVAALRGEVLVAIHGVVVPARGDGMTHEQLARPYFDGDTIVGDEYLPVGRSPARLDFRAYSAGQ